MFKFKKLVIVLLVLVIAGSAIGCSLVKSAAVPTPVPAAQLTPVQRIAQLENKIVLLERQITKLEEKIAALEQH